MKPRYEHTQIGYTILGVVLPVGLLSLTPPLLFDDGVGVGFGLSVGMMGVGVALFCSLTVRIADDTLVWYFGPRFWRNAVPTAKIEAVETVQTSISNGWGIRQLREGWLYNVSGFDAVRIEMRDGTTVFIGTDEPDRLVSVLDAEIRDGT
jgi:hypothetical protein